ncbi:MAG: pseudouridine synthase [Metamycoplasmataceae bacterium]
MKETRVQKLISHAGVASRREAEELIKKGQVLINGEPAVLGQKAKENDEIIVNGKVLPQIKEHKYYIINKPKKTVCTLKDNFNRTIITDLIDEEDYIYPVGRLDYNTTGALLLMNNGELANKLIHPSFEIVRKYRARLDNTLTKKELLYLNGDNIYVNGKLSKQNVELIESRTYLVTLKEGSYHHIKKLFELVEREVVDLKRVEFAGLTVEKLMVGEYRKLKALEVRALKKLVGIGN